MADTSTTIQEQIDRLNTVKNEIGEQFNGYFGIGGGGDWWTLERLNNALRSCGGYNASIKYDPNDGEYYVFEFHKDTVPEFMEHSSQQNIATYPYINSINGIDKYIPPISVKLGNMVINYFIVSNVLESVITINDYSQISITIMWPGMTDDMKNIRLLPMGFLYADNSDAEDIRESITWPVNINKDLKEIRLEWYSDEIYFQPDNPEHCDYFYSHENEGTYTKMFYKLIWDPIILN